MVNLDLTDCRFGRLVAVKRVNNKKTGTYWHCKCDCGNHNDVFIGHLRAGKTRSCGCLVVDTHSTHRLSRTPEHISWCAMRGRCLIPETNGYERYGGIGIKICKRWDDFENFLEDMGPRLGGCTLERLDSRVDYSPDNCMWATYKEQSANRINSRRYVIEGEVFKSAYAAGIRYGVSHVTILKWCKEKRCPRQKLDCYSYPLYG